MEKNPVAVLNISASALGLASSFANEPRSHRHENLIQNVMDGVVGIILSLIGPCQHGVGAIRNAEGLFTGRDRGEASILAEAIVECMNFFRGADNIGVESIGQKGQRIEAASSDLKIMLRHPKTFLVQERQRRFAHHRNTNHCLGHHRENHVP